MARLYKTTTARHSSNYNTGAELLIENLEMAETFWERGRGLLGRTELQPGHALWIKPCNNIHTYFMKFEIDCIFIDRNMEIKKIVKNVKPFRLVGPFWRTHSVIETRAGFADERKLEVGDQLYVVS